jgi:ADP-ribosylglycohydrolase
MKNDKLKGLMWGALLGDAYSLSGHWVYDQEALANSNLNFKGLNDPLSSYHPTKKAGDFTHYGDQTVWLLEHLQGGKRYDPFEYSDFWQKNMTHYTGYKDGASTASLQNLQSGKSIMGCGSDSTDLSIVGRHAPLLFSLENIDEMLESLKLHNFLTHFTKETLDASKYIAEVTLAMIYNLEVEKTLEERAKFYGTFVEAEVAKAFALKDTPTNEALQQLGISCNVKGGLASTVYLILNYHKNFEALLKANVLAGGDSSARAMVAGMVVGAKYGFEAIKPSWIRELNAYEKLNELID